MQPRKSFLPEEKVTNKEGVVPANLREKIFLSNRKIEELDKADIPSLIPKEKSPSDVKKKEKSLILSLLGLYTDDI